MSLVLADARESTRSPGSSDDESIAVSRPRRAEDLNTPFHRAQPSLARCSRHYPIYGSCVRTVAASAARTTTALVLTDSNIVPAALGGPYHWGALISRSTH
jgi:hypothetical protein